MSKTISGILAVIGVLVGVGGVLYFHVLRTPTEDFSAKKIIASIVVGVVLLAIGLFGLVQQPKKA